MRWRAVPLVPRVALVVLFLSSAVVGAWAQVAPKSFYDSFPGFGRMWVALDGPYNQHLVRDVGVLNLALAAVVLAVLLRPERYFVMIVAAAELVYTAPHFLYHLFHLDVYESADKVGMVVSLGVTVLAPIALLLHSSRAREAAIHR